MSITKGTRQRSCQRTSPSPLRFTGPGIGLSLRQILHWISTAWLVVEVSITSVLASDTNAADQDARRASATTEAGSDGITTVAQSLPEGDPSPSPSLSPDKFARAFEGSVGLFWVIAASVTGDRTAAEDVIQDAAVTAFGKLSEFDPATSFTAWMGQIVRYTALNHARKVQRRRTSLDDDDMDQATAGFGDRGRGANPDIGHPSLRLWADGSLPSTQVHVDDEIVSALADLNGIARACLLLRTIEHLSYREIARTLGIPEGTAMSHVRRS